MTVGDFYGAGRPVSRCSRQTALDQQYLPWKRLSMLCSTIELTGCMKQVLAVQSNQHPHKPIHKDIRWCPQHPMDSVTQCLLSPGNTRHSIDMVTLHMISTVQCQVHLIKNPGALIIDGNPVPGCSIRLGVHILQPLGQDAHILQVNVKQLLEAWPLHLDDYLLSIQGCQMHLHSNSINAWGNGQLEALQQDIVQALDPDAHSSGRHWS